VLKPKATGMRSSSVFMQHVSRNTLNFLENFILSMEKFIAELRPQRETLWI